MPFPLARYLDDIETRLVAEEELRLQHEWRQWMRHENAGGVFTPTPRTMRPSNLKWPHAKVNDALIDEDIAIYRELENVNLHLARGTGYIPSIRVNTGVGNIATALGAELFVMPYDTDTLPNVRSLGERATRALLNRPYPKYDAGNFAVIERLAARFRAIQAQYPNIARFIRIAQPDLQSPMDNLELLWGSSIFYALYDCPDVVHALLNYITGAIERYMDRWIQLFPDDSLYSSYFNHIDQGRICLRDDSAMNLSPDQYAEFIAPYNGRLLKKYGGIVHFCGRGEHFISNLTALPRLYGVNMSQPQLNDMEKIYAATVDHDIHLSLPRGMPLNSNHKWTNLMYQT